MNMIERARRLVSTALAVTAVVAAVPAVGVLAVRPVSTDEEIDPVQQFNIPVPRSNVRAFRRLASGKGKTMAQWALDELNAAVKRDFDQLRENFEEETARARREMELLEAKLSSPDLQVATDVQDSKGTGTSAKRSSSRRVST